MCDTATFFCHLDAAKQAVNTTQTYKTKDDNMSNVFAGCAYLHFQQIQSNVRIHLELCFRPPVLLFWPTSTPDGNIWFFSC